MFDDLLESNMKSKISEKIIDTILEKGLGHSTFLDRYPDAYNDLLKYRKDMIHDAKTTLKKFLETVTYDDAREEGDVETSVSTREGFDACIKVLKSKL